jgi:hypothetical protein
MKRWMVCGFVAVGLTGGVAWMFNHENTPAAPANGSQTTTIATPSEPAPRQAVVLTQVVETSDLAPLLDPSEKPIAGEPFEADAPALPTKDTTASVPDRIPAAKDDESGGQ